MSDTQSGHTTATLPEDELFRKYRNVREVLPDTAVAKIPSKRFHRHDAESDDLAPACQTTRPNAEWAAVDVDTALAMGVTPCRGCWRPVLQYLAADPRRRSNTATKTRQRPLRQRTYSRLTHRSKTQPLARNYQLSPTK